ncbi:MAG: GtrA family protein [Methanoregula sp.]|nr:GtrA family protein [Methanoregula sp.]
MTGWFAAPGREHLLWFLLVGVVSSLVDIGLLYYFCEYWGIWYLPAATASYCCGILVSYCLNKYLTFRDGSRNYLLQFTTFAVISISCLMVNVCIIWLAVELASLNYLTAKVIATVCAFFWNYYGQSRITFRRG